MQAQNQIALGNTMDISSELNANQLKLIAIIAMALDHLAVVFLPEASSLWLLAGAIGRLTAPIMCFFIAEGYHHTRSRKRYALRLLAGALVSHVPHALCFGFSVWEFWRATSVMWSLFLGLLALMAWENRALALPRRLGAVALCCLLSYPGNWNCIAVLWVVCFGVLRDAGWKKWLAFAGVTGLYLAEFFVIESNDPLWLRLTVLAAVPLLMLYNGKRGSRRPVYQWGYYLFYPLHFLALYLLRICIV